MLLHRMLILIQVVNLNANERVWSGCRCRCEPLHDPVRRLPSYDRDEPRR